MVFQDPPASQLVGTSFFTRAGPKIPQVRGPMHRGCAPARGHAPGDCLGARHRPHQGAEGWKVAGTSHCSWKVFFFFPPPPPPRTAESFGVSAQRLRVVWGGPEVKFHEGSPGFHQGSTRVPPGFRQGSTRVPRGSARAVGWCEH